jgi:meso-butanediol dehydrogenase/(S,S)-butanediol dehydrogenase/diacetyl reductase
MRRISGYKRERQMQLDRQVAFVTGGGSGIGRAICERFAAEGATIIAADWNLPLAEETIRLIEASGGSGLAIDMDVSRAAQVNAAIALATSRYGQIDLLVANAGLSDGTDILTIDEETWDRNLDIVLKGTYLCARAVLPAMIARKSGVILTISSVNGLTGLGEEAYSAAKAGLMNLTRNLAMRYGRDGIRANCICPGTIQTPIWDRRLLVEPDALDTLKEWYPLGRVGMPSDIANAALFLCSRQASWITGETLNVDGGLMAGLYRMSEDLSGRGKE